MKRADENEKENKNLIRLEGVEGYWYEQPDILSKYKRRDDRLEKICYCHYGRMIRSGGKMAHIENDHQKEIDLYNRSGTNIHLALAKGVQLSEQLYPYAIFICFIE